MIVVIDTNVWKQELYLTSGASAALKLYLKRNGAVIAMPEVIELEIRAHLRNDVVKECQDARASHGRLVALFGSLQSIQLPSDQQIDELVRNFVDSCGLKFRKVPFGLESARDSLERTIDKRPPSTHSQQFKDGVIWADCKALAKEDEVILVTSDVAFYKNKKVAEGMDEALAKEVRKLPYQIRLLPKLADLMEQIKTDLHVDNAVLTEAIMGSSAGAELLAHIDADELTLGPLTVSAQYFATEDPDRIYVEFELTAIASDETPEQRGDARFVLTCSCSFNEESGTFCDFQPRSMVMGYVKPSRLAGNTSMIKYGIGATTTTSIYQPRFSLD